MLFKELKPGFTVYILDKATMTFTTEKVKDVSLPHIDPKIASTNMVVDVTVIHEANVNGVSTPASATTFCVPCDSDIAYPQNKVITTDKSNILREVESMKSISEQAISQIDHHKDMINKANSLIADLDPTQREKQANEARFANIEASMNKMMQMLTNMQKHP